MPGHEPQPAGLGPHAEQDLGHRQGQQFGVAEFEWASGVGRPPEMIVDLDGSAVRKVFRSVLTN
jgi:hypothetical protein